MKTTKKAVVTAKKAVKTAKKSTKVVAKKPQTLSKEEALETVIAMTINMVEKNPNDASLGKAIRRFYNLILVTDK